MTCQACQERQRKLRDAWLNGQIAEALKQAALGAAEITGIKPKDKSGG